VCKAAVESLKKNQKAVSTLSQQLLDESAKTKKLTADFEAKNRALDAAAKARNELEDKGRAVAKLQAQIAELKLKAEEAQKQERDAVARVAEQAERDRARADLELRRARADMSRASKSQSEFEAELLALRAELDAKSAEAETLARASYKATDARFEAECRVEALTAELENLQHGTVERDAVTQQLRERVAELEQCRGLLSAEKHKMEDGLSSVQTSLEEQVRAARARIAELLAELGAAHELTAMLRKEKADGERDLLAARKKAKEAAGAQAEGSTKLAAMEEELKKNQTVLTNVRIDKAKADDLLKTHKKRLKDHAEQLAALEQQKQKLSAEITELKKVREARDERHAAQLAELHEAVAEKDGLILSLEQKVKLDTEQLRKANEQLDASAERLRESAKQVAELTASAKQARDEASALAERSQQAEDALAHLRELHAQLLAEHLAATVRLEAELARAETAHANAAEAAATEKALRSAAEVQVTELMERNMGLVVKLRALDGSDKEADLARERLAAVSAELAAALARADEQSTRWRKATDELRATEVKASQADAKAKEKVQASKTRVHELEQSTKKLERELADTKVGRAYLTYRAACLALWSLELCLCVAARVHARISPLHARWRRAHRSAVPHVAAGSAARRAHEAQGRDGVEQELGGRDSEAEG
jgi:chromosome segregation ATPase